MQLLNTAKSATTQGLRSVTIRGVVIMGVAIRSVHHWREGYLSGATLSECSFEATFGGCCPFSVSVGVVFMCCAGASNFYLAPNCSSVKGRTS